MGIHGSTFRRITRDAFRGSIPWFPMNSLNRIRLSFWRTSARLRPDATTHGYNGVSFRSSFAVLERIAVRFGSEEIGTSVPSK
jgi:hypothetical protein